jgi:hypothetical protein
MYGKVILFIVLGALSGPLFGQGRQVLDQDDKFEELTAATKQVNQFFRRFNGEEDLNGDRFQEGDKRYHEYKVRKQYLPVLIDQSVSTGSSEASMEFVKFVNDKRDPVYLDHHIDDWFAEVSSVFKWNNKNVPVTLLMKFKAQGLGYEWVIDDVSISKFEELFTKDTSKNKPFIHPMSHELGFMSLRKAFAEGMAPESYTMDDFKPDFLTLFLFEIKSRRMIFSSVQTVKFHYFGVPGWYFELSNFNRPGFSSGWLISNLVTVDQVQTEMLKDYIYGR